MSETRGEIPSADEVQWEYGPSGTSPFWYLAILAVCAVTFGLWGGTYTFVHQSPGGYGGPIVIVGGSLVIALALFIYAIRRDEVDWFTGDLAVYVLLFLGFGNALSLASLWGFLCLVNCVPDFSREQSSDMRIVGREIISAKRRNPHIPKYRLNVVPADGSERISIPVDQSTYERASAGDLIRITHKSGLLGRTWMKRYELHFPSGSDRS
jgi:hypothetical protein